jgi:hypothetical protein
MATPTTGKSVKLTMYVREEGGKIILTSDDPDLPKGFVIDLPPESVGDKRMRELLDKHGRLPH